jgi:sarcosine oxidase subunit beta
MVETADVVVIGGGCTGASIAMRLAERGVRKVVLLEKNYLASGPTGKSIGNVRPYAPTEEVMKIIQRSLDTFQNFSEEIGGDPGLVPTTRIRIVPENDKKALATEAVWQKKMGINLRLLSPQDLTEVMPQLNTEGIGAAIQYLDACYLNPVATTGAFAVRARDLGADIREETEVTDIKVSAGRVQSVVTDRGEIATAAVVNAAGAWSRIIAQMAGVDLPITVKRGDVCFFLRPWDFLGIIPSVHNVAKEHTYRCEGNDLQLAHDVDARKRLERLVEDPDKFNEEVDEDTVALFLRELPLLFPPMKRASYRGGYASVFDCSPDENPIIGKVSEVAGFYLCSGWSGLGFQQSPAIGEIMAELITDDKTTLVDWSVFRLSRFEEGKTIPSAWEYRENESNTGNQA